MTNSSKKKGINNVTINATHPGFVGSKFGQDSNKGFLVNMIYKVGWYFSDTVDKGAISEVFLATSPKIEESNYQTPKDIFN